MTEQDSTCVCQVCGTTYSPTLNKNGKPRKVKHSLCRDPKCRNIHRYSARKGTEDRDRASRSPRLDGNGAPIMCSVSCCDAFAKTRGMCAKHYVRVKKHGNPDFTTRGLRVEKPCIVCGEVMRLKPAEAKTRVVCSLHCVGIYAGMIKGHILHASKSAKDSFYGARRRSLIAGGSRDAIDPMAVFERDKWKCHLCGRNTKKSLRGTFEPLAPELEHIVALSDGGTHTWGNVACSCRSCNLGKGAASFGQLGLGFAA